MTTRRILTKREGERKRKREKNRKQETGKRPVFTSFLFRLIVTYIQNHLING